MSDESVIEHLERTTREPLPAQLDEASKLLLKAAALIEVRGWVQGNFECSRGYCIGGAAIRADTTLGRVVYPIALKRVSASLGTFYVGWNDTPGRTKDEVVAKLRAVALGG